MAASHICRRCGTDLARRRSRVEPQYGLRIVDCPKCDTVMVRRRHPLSRWFRYALRLDAAVVFLLVQLVLLVGMTAMTVSSVTGITHALLAVADGLPIDISRATLLIILLLPSFLVGAWLGAAFRHLPLWRVYLYWIAFVALLLCIPAIVILLPLDGVRMEIGADRLTLDQETLATRFTAAVRMGGTSLIVFAAMTGVSLITAALGLFLSKFGRVIRSARWRMRRRRRRAGRFAV